MVVFRHHLPILFTRVPIACLQKGGDIFTRRQSVAILWIILEQTSTRAINERRQLKMSKDNEKEKEESIAKSMDRREFLKRSAVGAGTIAATMVMGGCGSSSSDSSSSSAGAAGVPTAQAFKFGVMADSQWLSTDDGYNPNTSAISIIKSLQQEFISKGVRFVIQAGDTADKANTGTPTSTSTESGYSVTATLAEDTRALFTQALFNAGIGFFPYRGNHDDSVAAEFVRVYPQTQNGTMNSTPSDIFSISNPDSKNQPTPAKSGSTFTLGSNFNSPDSSVIPGNTGNLKGLTYSFDYQNARFIMIDQFTPADGKNPDGTAYNLSTSAQAQQPWISKALAGKPSGGHAFVFSHKGLITQQHQDVLFGNDPSTAGSPGVDAFIRSMYNNSAHFYFCGHDHMHNRSIVSTIDGVNATDGTTANVTHILCSSDSSKFYTPNENDPSGNPPVPVLTSNNYYYCGGKRQTQLNQELYTVGYYVVTVDGPNCTVDFHSAPVYPTYSANTENLITSTPTLNFTKRETFGYSVKGKQFVVASGKSYTVVSDKSSSGTTANILNGTNGILTRSLSAADPVFSVSVNTGWYPAMSNTAGDILALWGMAYTLGSDQTDNFVLSMGFNPGGLTSSQLTSGTFGIASPDANGNWTNTVNDNFNGGAKTFVAGPWNSSYTAPGTYGVDTSTNTAWAVINHNGYFAVVNGI